MARVVTVPEGITSEQAAAMMLKGMTVQYLLKRTYKVSAGETVLFHAAEHFFIGLGPSVSHDLSKSYSLGSRQIRATQIGLSSMVGGWL